MSAFLGLIVFICTAFLFSERKKSFPIKLVFICLALQFFLCFLSLRLDIFSDFFSYLTSFISILETSSERGSSFVFGYLSGAKFPAEITDQSANFIIAFRVMPIIIFISALSSLLFHLGVLPLIIKVIGMTISKLFQINSALSFGVASSLFLGTIEAPLTIKSYLNSFSKSDLFVLVTASMSTISGSVLVLYSSVLSSVLPDAASHLSIASILSIPAAIMFSRIMVPKTSSDVFSPPSLDSFRKTSIMDAIISGTEDGVKMVINIIAIIMVLFSLVYLADIILASVHTGLSIKIILGFLCRPIMWLIGIEWNETAEAASLFGDKVVLNEFVAYLNLSKLGTEAVSTRSATILSYALCGFANFSSVGIISSGLSAIMDENKKALVIGLVTKALISGNLATLTTAAICSFFI